MPRQRFTSRLTIRYVALVLCALIAFAWLAARAFEHSLTRSTWTEIEAAANLAATEAAAHWDPSNPASAADAIRRIADNTQTRLTIVITDGSVAQDSRDDPARLENQSSRPEIAAALAGETGADTRFSDAQREDVMFVAVPLRISSKIVAAIRAAKSSAEIQQIYRNATSTLLLILIGLAIVTGFVGWQLARNIGHELEPIRRSAELLSHGGPMPKLSLSDVEEFASLSASLSQIADQLEERTLRIGRKGHEQEAVLASMMEGVLAVDSEQRLIELNAAAADLVGSPHAELQGRNLHEVIRNADLRRFVERALESPDPIEDDVVLHGEPQRILRVRGTALRDGRGTGIGAVIVLNDVTRYHHLENLRRDFVANVSHELKTPIASIKGFVETLLDGALEQPEDAHRFLRIIASHADRLNNIIEDLLSLSKIEQSEEAADLPLVQASLRPVLEAALIGCQTLAAAKSIELTLDCDDTITAHINPPLLEQAVINLIDNAVKYSEPGRKVEILTRQDDDEIAIDVRDRGCGIAPQHLPRLFERFYRVDRARSRKLGGTGLGLAIVKHIVQAHQGRIDVESTPGEGSVFSIHLPLQVGVPAAS